VDFPDKKMLKQRGRKKIKMRSYFFEVALRNIRELVALLKTKVPFEARI